MEINATEKKFEPTRYYTKLYYYGKLVDWDYCEGAMVLKLNIYAACEYCGTNVNIRLYVPTDLEKQVLNMIQVGNYYFIQAIPYKLKFNKRFPYRVDLLLNIFERVV